MEIKTKTQRLTVTSLLLAIGIVLPFATSHGMGIAGTVLLPMHIPVFLCGLLCGPLYGAVCGALLPALNCLLTSMPAPFPMLPIMACELFTYGLISGLLNCKTPLRKKKYGVYLSMLGAMICGRIAYGLVFHILLISVGELKALSVWAAIVTGLPGIIIQIILIPCLIFIIGGNMSKENTNAIESAKNLIRTGNATCVVIKDGRIVNTERGQGIKPIIALYEQGRLEGAVVVDKIVGKAAAMIMTLGGVKSCYGLTVSRSAVEYLKKRNIDVKYDTCAERIINRKGDGMCPMEETVLNTDDPEIALKLIKAKISELSERSSK